MTFLSIVAAFAIFVVLAIAFSRSSGAKVAATQSLLRADSDLAKETDGRDRDFSRQIISRVFSTDDQEFINTLGSPELRFALSAERKRLAIRWVRSNALEASGIVRDHLAMAARTTDLRLTGEAQLALRYLELRLFSNILLILVVCFGPGGLRGMAAQAESLMAALRASGGRGKSVAKAVLS